MPQLWPRVAIKMAQNRRAREPQRLACGCSGVAEPSTSFGGSRTRIVLFDDDATTHCGIYTAIMGGGGDESADARRRRLSPDFI